MDSKLRAEITQLHAELCGGLADPTRIMILYTLAEKSHAVNQIVKNLNLPQPTVSRHLKILRDRQLVTTTRKGQSVWYTLRDPRIIDALNILRGVMKDHLQNQAVLAEQTTITEQEYIA